MANFKNIIAAGVATTIAAVAGGLILKRKKDENEAFEDLKEIENVISDATSFSEVHQLMDFANAIAAKDRRSERIAILHGEIITKCEEIGGNFLYKEMQDKVKAEKGKTNVEILHEELNTMMNGVDTEEKKEAIKLPSFLYFL